ncbi:MAG: hypothetical protein JST80_02875 [Bdellovibrionales bacterium]|nr:hypothetical protein [Bdellovibrionales bacterium]
MIKKHEFPMPDGVTEVTDEYQINLAHYELLHLKPKGTILFAKEKQEIKFQFFAAEDRVSGIFARLDEPLSPNTKRIMEYVQRYPRTECLVAITLLNFKMIYVSARVENVPGAKQKTLRFNFPTHFLKTHRRKFIRIPFNDTFPAELKFETDRGPQVRRLRDLSREGMRLKLEDSDLSYFQPGVRLKQARLKVLNREMPVGVSIISQYPGLTAGLRIIAIGEEDKVWIKDCIRVLMKQILNLSDAPFDDEIEKGVGE